MICSVHTYIDSMDDELGIVNIAFMAADHEFAIILDYESWEIQLWLS